MIARLRLFLRKKWEISLVLIFWLWTFIASIMVINFIGRKITPDQKIEQQFLVLKEMSENWIAEANMAQRIQISDISIKTFKTKIIQVKVNLKTREFLTPTYQRKLLKHLSHKAESETGVLYSFDITTPENSFKFIKFKDTKMLSIK